MVFMVLSLGFLSAIAPPGAQAQPQELLQVEVTEALGGEPEVAVARLDPANGGDQVAFPVSEAEATAIALHAQRAQTPRPMSHQLLCNVLTTLGLTLRGAIIGPPDYRDSRPGWLWVEDAERRFVVPARPGDAIAAALCADAPIFVADKPLEGSEPPPEDALRPYTFLSCERDEAGVPGPHDVVCLDTPDGARRYSIRVGLAEADSIFLAMDEPRPPRLRVHGTTAEVLRLAGVTVKRLVIADVINGTIMGSLVLDVLGEEVEVDCRPSDGIAIALRAQAPIYMGPAAAAALGVRP